QSHHFFAIKAVFALRNHGRVGHDVIDIVRAQRAGKTQIIDLNGGGAQGEEIHPHLAEIAVDIDQNVDVVGDDGGGGIVVGQGSDGNEFVETSHHTLAHGAAVIVTIVESEHFETRAVVALEQAGHQIHSGLGAKF